MNETSYIHLKAMVKAKCKENKKHSENADTSTSLNFDM